jgi:hypothetical protein
MTDYVDEALTVKGTRGRRGEERKEINKGIKK